MQEVVRHRSCPTKPNLTTPDFVGELPCRTNSAFRVGGCGYEKVVPVMEGALSSGRIEMAD